MTENSFLNNIFAKLQEKGVSKFNFSSAYKHTFIYRATADDISLTVYLGGTGDDIYREQFDDTMSFDEFQERSWLCGFAVYKEGDKTYHYDGIETWTLQN